MTRIKLRAGCTVRELPDGDAVVAAGEGDTAVIVNGSAHAVLDLLSGGASEESIAGVLCEQYPLQDAASIRRDVAALLAELAKAGLVEPDSSDDPPGEGR